MLLINLSRRFSILLFKKGTFKYSYQVPKDVQAKLLLPLLTPRAKMLVSRLSAEDLGDIGKIRDFLTTEFKITPREYRARFCAATSTAEETHVACRVEVCMGVGNPMGIPFLWESHGNGNSIYFTRLKIPKIARSHHSVSECSRDGGED